MSKHTFPRGKRSPQSWPHLGCDLGSRTLVVGLTSLEEVAGSRRGVRQCGQDECLMLSLELGLVVLALRLFLWLDRWLGAGDSLS